MSITEQLLTTSNAVYVPAILVPRAYDPSGQKDRRLWGRECIPAKHYVHASPHGSIPKGTISDVKVANRSMVGWPQNGVQSP